MLCLALLILYGLIGLVLFLYAINPKTWNGYVSEVTDGDDYSPSEIALVTLLACVVVIAIWPFLVMKAFREE